MHIYMDVENSMRMAACIFQTTGQVNGVFLVQEFVHC